jgi:hypothetical protein
MLAPLALVISLLAFLAVWPVDLPKRTPPWVSVHA